MDPKFHNISICEYFILHYNNFVLLCHAFLGKIKNENIQT